MSLKNNPLLEKESLGFLLLTTEIQFSHEQSALLLLFQALQRMLLLPKVSEADYVWVLSLVAHRQFELWHREGCEIDKRIRNHLRQMDVMSEIITGARSCIQDRLRPLNEFATSSPVCINKAFLKCSDSSPDYFLSEAAEIEYRRPLYFHAAFSSRDTSQNLDLRYPYDKIRKEHILFQIDEHIQEQGLHHPDKLHDAVCQHVFGMDREAFLHQRDVPFVGFAERGARLAALHFLMKQLEIMAIEISRSVDSPIRPMELNTAQHESFYEHLRHIQSWTLRGLFGSDNNENLEKAYQITGMIHDVEDPAIRQKLKNTLMRVIYEAVEVFEDMFEMVQWEPDVSPQEKSDTERDDIKTTSTPLFKGYHLNKSGLRPTG